MKFKNKVAVVTGAGGGLGKVFALELLKEGATVVLTDISQQALDNVTDNLAEFPGQYMLHPLDVTQGEQVRQLMKKVFEKYGQIDFLLNSCRGSLFTPKN
jgi:NADP-dependent 3-hydroxy acid dehydrogenase YdfG